MKVEPYIFSVVVNKKWKVLFKNEQDRDKFLRFVQQKNVPAMCAMLNDGSAMKVALPKDDVTNLSGKHPTIVGLN